MSDSKPVKHYVRQALELVEAHKALVGQGKIEQASAKLLQANHVLQDVIPGLPTYPQFCANPKSPFVQSYHELCAVVNSLLPLERQNRSESLPDTNEDDLTRRFERLRGARSLPKDSASASTAPHPPIGTGHLLKGLQNGLLVVGRNSSLKNSLNAGTPGIQAYSPPQIPPIPKVFKPPAMPQLQSRLASPLSNIPAVPKCAPPPPPSQPQNGAAAVVDVNTLRGWLKYIPDLVVILDVRDRDDFDRCHIEAPWIACLEPVSLRANMSDADLEDSLVIAPDSESAAFSARKTVKHVVVYTKNSRSGSELSPPVSYVFQALESAGIHPTLLNGGFDAWLEAVLPVVATTVSRDRSPFKMDDELPSGDWVVSNGAVGSHISSLSHSFESPPKNEQLSVVSSTSSISGSSLPSAPIYSPPQPPSSSEEYRAFNLKYPDLKEPSYQLPQTQQFAMRTHSRVLPQPIPRVPVSSQVPPLSMPSSLQTVPTILPVSSRNRMPSPSGLPGPSTPASPRSDSIRVTWPKSQKYHVALSYLTGLVNLGNTCYMNCILQCLQGTPQLAVPFLDRSYKQFVNVKSRLGYQGRMANEFAALTTAMARAGTGGYVAARGMKNLAGILNETFAGTDQQDCQEFLVFVLDGLHEDLNVNGHRERLRELDEREERVRERYNVRLASTIEWERYLKSDTSLIVDMFQGQYMSRLKCMVCGTTSSTYTAFSTLSLPLAAGRSIDLYQCFAQFVAPEVLDGDDAWFCSHCKRKQRTIKTMSISRLPPVLVIHLKRFKRTMHSVDKLETPVQYPLYNLDLTGYWPNPEITDPEHRNRLDQLPKRGQQPPFRYNLYAVTAHDGSLKSGHYTAYVSKPGTGWCHYDDIHVTRVSEQAALTNKAYLLFYQRI
ncbi:Ubiquitin carboxyl-terminal hydrolase 4 [Wickerhamiella sorbophila]|uniref:Ubiquitin carboxyl-terminal hydrolase n=1 Tax=Wickerhamiella sorbophila TaxID=45607 RepID=A0A2T0FBJ2_9ASCO|nr:Ubiquitin carboxyl-terminal hydrolase 4 [Wickerhamiella sorbophila]PRT52383.1 Ubiquitin carboxyl-terminal hydrolase 4 [Wickerhamiella sorbophila]